MRKNPKLPALQEADECYARKESHSLKTCVLLDEN